MPLLATSIQVHFKSRSSFKSLPLCPSFPLQKQPISGTLLGVSSLSKQTGNWVPESPLWPLNILQRIHLIIWQPLTCNKLSKCELTLPTAECRPAGEMFAFLPDQTRDKTQHNWRVASDSFCMYERNAIIQNRPWRVWALTLATRTTIKQIRGHDYCALLFYLYSGQPTSLKDIIYMKKYGKKHLKVLHCKEITKITS